MKTINQEKFLKRYTNDESVLEKWLKRAQNGEPLTKIVNERHFWEHAFFINEHVLDPRQETETLIEAVIQMYPDRSRPFRFLDLGTGSGCILISLLHEYPNSTGVGLDISEEALKVAHQNGAFLKDRIEFRLGSWWDAVKGETFDIVVSNPPYIATDEKLDASVLNYDPHLALFGGKDGLDAYRALFLGLKTVGFFEIGYQQEQKIHDLALEYDLQVEKTFKDLINFVRVVMIKAPK